MEHSTQSSTLRKVTSDKPKKPYPDFPLFPHATRRWCKKIRGKHHYFGSWDNPDSALKEYLEQKDFLFAGKEPPTTDTDGLTIIKLCNLFMNFKKSRVDNGELKKRTWKDYDFSCKRMIEFFGKTTLVEGLQPADFGKLRDSISKTRNLISLKNEIQRIRTIFKFAFDNRFIEKTVFFGQQFDKPRKEKIEGEKEAQEEKHGKRMFQSNEIRLMLEHANTQLRAMILLAINTGYHNSDVANITLKRVEEAFKNKNWLEFPRTKNYTKRRCHLWNETVKALKAYLAIRREPKSESNEEIFFLTNHGNKWVRVSLAGYPDDQLGKEFNKLLRLLDIKRDGVCFRALRSTFQTVGDDACDPIATKQLMGHKDGSMSDHYRKGTRDEQLKAVTDTIYHWLFSEAREGGIDNG